MRSLPSAVQTHLSSNLPIRTEVLFWIDPTVGDSYGYTTAISDQSLSIINPSTGSSVTRSFYGGGRVVSVPQFVDVAKLEIKNIMFGLSASSSVVNSMLGAIDLRGADIEIYLAFYDARSETLLATPEAFFQGYIGNVEKNSQAIDVEGGESEEVWEINCTSFLRDLSATSSKTRSRAHGQERDGDDIFAYAGTAANWEIEWGGGRHRHSKGGGGDNGNDKIPDMGRRDW